VAFYLDGGTTPIPALYNAATGVAQAIDVLHGLSGRAAPYDVRAVFTADRTSEEGRKYANSQTTQAVLFVSTANAVVWIVPESLTQEYNGLVKLVIAQTLPAGLAVDITFSATPVAAGSYNVTATIVEPNYTGSTSGVLTIAPRPVSVTTSNAGKTYGASDPAPLTTASASGFLPADGIAVAGFSRAAGEAVGSYHITTALSDPISRLANYIVTNPGATFTISSAVTTTTVSATPNPANAGQPVTITASVSAAFGAVTEGSVIFLEGATTLAGPTALNASGTASFTTAALLAGTHTLTAQFVPTPNLVGSLADVTVAITAVGGGGGNAAPVAHDKAVTVIVRPSHRDDDDDDRDDHDRHDRRRGDSHGWNGSYHGDDDDIDREWEDDADRGRAVRITLSGVDVDSDNLSFHIVTPLAHGVLSRIRRVRCDDVDGGTSCTARVIYFVEPHYLGIDSFTYRVHDGQSYSNVATVTINLVPPFTGYTQGQWGSPTQGNSPGALLASGFDDVYPDRVFIGAGTRRLEFTNAAAVRAFLPAGGKAGTLPSGPSYPIVNPTSSKGGVFAGNVLALQLNVDFSASGKTRTGFGELRLARGELAGSTVAEVLTLANQVLGTGSGLPAGLSLNELNAIVASINSNFARGKDDDGYLVP
jgi:hypothetical protein